MKLYEYVKGENRRTAKLFGFPIMEQTSDNMTSKRIQTFLGGLISTEKENNLCANSINKNIKFLGKSIIQRVEQNGYKDYFICGKKFYSVSLMSDFKKRYFKYFDKKHDDIYILKANSGEVYLFLTFLSQAYFNKNGSKTPLLVATRKYHVDLIKMICPEIPYVFIDNFQINFNENSFKIDGFRFFLLFSCKYFKQVETDIKTNPIGKSHYFESIVAHLGLREGDITMKGLKVPEDAEKSMLEKVSKTGLNMEKFIFIAPEASSCQLYEESFWEDLIKEIQTLGYDVFVNMIDKTQKFENAKSYKTCELSYMEVFALAKRAKRIISLRSGLSEFLLQTGVPMEVLYTKFKYRHFFEDMDVEHVISGFGLLRLPQTDTGKIREFNMLKISASDCISEILATCK